MHPVHYFDFELYAFALVIELKVVNAVNNPRGSSVQTDAQPMRLVNF